MSDFKSKLPDLNELASMAEKFFKDMKNSVSEIIESYNQKHHQEKTADKEKNNKE
jgi:F0F1-type ATP synthase membrane subunit b/b'